MSFRKKVEVLLVIDYNKRELLGMLLVQHFLWKRGIRAKIVNDLVIAIALEKYRPKIMVVGSPQLALAEYAENCRIAVVLTEHGSGQKTLIKDIVSGVHVSKDCIENVDLFFRWGEFMTRFLIEENVFPKRKIETYGSPFSDHWRLAQGNQRNPTKQVGIATTWRVLGKPVNLMSWLDDAQNGGPEESGYFLDPEKSEVWVYWEASLIRLYGELIGALTSKGHSVQLRPSWPEVRSIYKFLEIKYKGKFSVGGNERISLWLSGIDVLITLMSTTALDAILAGVPVISVKKIVNQDAYSRIPQGYVYDYEEYLRQPENFGELEQMVKEATNGNLPLAPNVPKLHEVISDRFGLPRKDLASKGVAEAFGRYLPNIKQSQYVSVYPAGSWKNRLSKILTLIPCSLGLITICWFLAYLVSGGRIAEASRMTYRPWAIGENWHARSNKRRLLKLHESDQ